MTIPLFKDAEFVACVYRGLVDDFAVQARSAIAEKVFKNARKKFAAMLLKVGTREISAWDYYCYGLHKGNSAFRDKFISDYIRLALMKKLDKLPEAERRLIEISVLRLPEIDEQAVLRREVVHDLILSEINTLAAAHGATIELQPVRRPVVELSEIALALAAAEQGAYQASMNGASPA